LWNDASNSTAGTTVSYTIEAAKSGTNFAAPVALGTPTTSLFKDVTVGTLDAVAKTLGLPSLVESILMFVLNHQLEFLTFSQGYSLPNWEL
jgi:hypothetical protein